MRGTSLQFAHCLRDFVEQDLHGQLDYTHIKQDEAHLETKAQKYTNIVPNNNYYQTLITLHMLVHKYALGKNYIPKFEAHLHTDLQICCSYNSPRLHVWNVEITLHVPTH